MKPTYDKLYKTLDYGPVASARGLVVARHVVLLWKPCKVLCVGAGNAYEATYLSSQGYDVTVLDYVMAIPKKLMFKPVMGAAQNLPFKDDYFDLVICCECLEHIPENDVDNTLRELKRIAKFFYFTVSDLDDPPYHTHLCVKDAKWWLEKFVMIGFSGKMFKPAKYQEIVSGMVASKFYMSGTGFNIYGNKVLSQ